MIIDMDAYDHGGLTMLVHAASRPPLPSSIDSHMDSGSNTNIIPASHAPHRELYIIGISSLPEDELRRSLPSTFHLSAVLSKPFNGYLFTQLLQKIYQTVAPPVGHTGTNKIDLLNAIQAAYTAGQSGRYLPPNFQVSAGIASAAVEASNATHARIAARGAISNSLPVPMIVWNPPPPVPVTVAPVVEVSNPPQELTAKEKRAIAAKERAAAKANAAADAKTTSS
jgi:hypothetical protein